MMMTNVQNSMGVRLALERKRLGHTQAKWSDFLGLSRSAVAMMETDRASIDAERLVVLARYGLDMQFVLTGDRSTASAIDNINWELIEKIARQVSVWEITRGIQLDPSKRSLVLKHLYRHFCQKEIFDQSAIDELLSLAA